MAGGGVNRVEAFETDIHYRRQLDGRRHRGDSANGEARCGAHFVGVGLVDAGRGLFVEGQGARQVIDLAAVVAGDQNHDRLLTDDEDQGLDDGAELDAEGLGASSALRAVSVSSTTRSDRPAAARASRTFFTDSFSRISAIPTFRSIESDRPVGTDQPTRAKVRAQEKAPAKSTPRRVRCS
jgi:hypothetical protein